MRENKKKVNYSKQKKYIGLFICYFDFCFPKVGPSITISRAKSEENTRQLPESDHQHPVCSENSKKSGRTLDRGEHKLICLFETVIFVSIFL